MPLREPKVRGALPPPSSAPVFKTSAHGLTALGGERGWLFSTLLENKLGFKGMLSKALCMTLLVCARKLRPYLIL